MRPLIDCHVLHCYEPPEWIDGCLQSLEAEPVTVYLRPGIKGKVGLARARAFACGDAPYVAWVDGDDEAMPGAFDAALAVLESRPDAVSTYCDIQLIGQPEGQGYVKAPWNPASQLQRMAEVHHLHVMRRSAVMPWLEELARWDGWEEYVLMGLLCRYGVHHHIPAAAVSVPPAYRLSPCRDDWRTSDAPRCNQDRYAVSGAADCRGCAAG